MKLALARQTLALLAVLCPSLAGAADRWEAGSTNTNDDLATHTRNELQHGDIQVGHDLEGSSAAPDRDFYIVRTSRWHSYEAIVRSGTLYWYRPSAFCGAPPAVPICPRFDLVNGDTGAVLVAGVPDGAQNTAEVSSSLAVRWQVDVAGQTAYLRAIGDTGGVSHTAVDQYDVQLRDTTYAVPRFNNSGTQTTILVLQNLTDRPVFENTRFILAAGTSPVTVSTTIPPLGQFVLNTSTSMPGASGSVLIAHDGPYGALAGKAVALEPSTGFTFDTAMTPIPH